jgi:hypothetical protein
MARRRKYTRRATTPAIPTELQSTRDQVREALRKLIAQEQSTLVERETDRLMEVMDRELKAKPEPVKRGVGAVLSESKPATPTEGTPNGLDRKPGWQAREARRKNREAAQAAAPQA